MASSPYGSGGYIRKPDFAVNDKSPSPDTELDRRIAKALGLQLGGLPGVTKDAPANKNYYRKHETWDYEAERVVSTSYENAEKDIAQIKQLCLNYIEWRTVLGWEGIYEVSNTGQVRAVKQDRHRGGVLRPVSGDVDHRIYPAVTLNKGSKSSTMRVHRMVALAFIPNPENKPQVNHIDGDKRNNHVSNLEWATRSENQNHAVANGLKKHGEYVATAKLTNAQVAEMRRRYAEGEPQKVLADEYGVSLSLAHQAILGKTYNPNHLPTLLRNDTEAALQAQADKEEQE